MDSPGAESVNAGAKAYISVATAMLHAKLACFLALAKPLAIVIPPPSSPPPSPSTVEISVRTATPVVEPPRRVLRKNPKPSAKMRLILEDAAAAGAGRPAKRKAGTSATKSTKASTRGRVAKAPATKEGGAIAKGKKRARR
ncbi:hypothetical protein MMC07_004629 [Pseudocyphellaria aurata]|nr:hypothetical protein [Pseudocyphellaria aurata]